MILEWRGVTRCRRPVALWPAGYLVIRAAAVSRVPAHDPMLALDDGPDWSAGDLVDVYPVRRTRRCGTCRGCRLAVPLGAVGRTARRALEAVRRRNVTIAVVALMVGPAAVFVLCRFGAGRWF